MGKQYLHQSITDKLLGLIMCGDLEPGGKLPKTKELAREFDTSTVTIDRALAKLVELGYLSRKARRGSFITPRSAWPEAEFRERPAVNLYSLVMRDSPSPYFWKNTIKGIHDAVHEHDFGILSTYIDEDLEAVKKNLLGLRRKGVRGIVFAPLSMPSEEEYEEFNAEIIDLLSDFGAPFILVDRFLKSRNVSHVVSRDYEAAAALTEHLLSSGSKNPLFLTHLYNSPFAARIRGFRDTLLKNGFPESEIGGRIVDIAPGSILFDANNMELLAPVFRNLPDFDGVFAVNAVNLYACVNTLAHLRDPRAGTMRYVNVDDIGLLNIPGLSMSAIQESHRIGRLAGEILIGPLSNWRDSTFHITKDYCYRTYKP